MTQKPAGFFTKLRRFTPRENFALAEAMVLVTLAAPVIRLTPFRHLSRLASRPIRRPVEDPAARFVLIDRVTWAVSRAAKRSRLRALCFERGLTAQIMLRRRGIDSVLLFGAAPEKEKGLSAHVWVVADGYDVCGGDEAAGYAVLATFPADAAPAPRKVTV